MKVISAVAGCTPQQWNTAADVVGRWCHAGVGGKWPGRQSRFQEG